MTLYTETTCCPSAVIIARTVASPAREGSVVCRVGSMTASCVSAEGRGVVCILPGQRAQKVQVEVSRDGGETYDAGGPVLFEYVTGEVVSGMVPSEGPVGGGTRVQVVGEHFKAGRERDACLGGEGRMQWGGGSRARWCTARVR